MSGNVRTDNTSLMPLAFQQHAGAEGAFEVPDQVHLVPGGELVEGRDGRAFRVLDPQAVIKATELPMQFDVDHDSMSYFGSTKAYGWIDKVEYVEEDEEDGREAGFWGHVENWTPEGRELVANRTYRGISPVVRIQYVESSEGDGEVDDVPVMVSLVNAALTNRPNLKMTLLNRQEQQNHTPAGRTREENEGMHEALIQLARQLGLGSGCKPEELAHAVSEKMVPRTDLDAMEERAQHAESQIETDRTAALNAEADRAVGEAVKSGRVPPASKDFYRNSIHDRASLGAFTAEMKRRQPLVSPTDDDPPGGDGSGAIQLTQADKKAAAKMGIPEEHYLQAKKEGL